MSLFRRFPGFFCLGLIGLMASAQGQDLVRFATSGDYAPANMSDQMCDTAVGAVVPTDNGHRLCGFEIDLMTEVCKVRHLECVWTLQPFGWSEQNPNFPSLLSHLFEEKPAYDLVIAYLRGNQERLDKLTASGSYIEGYPVLYKSLMLQSKAIKTNQKGFPLEGVKPGEVRIAASGLYVEELQRADLAYYTPEQLKTIEILAIDSLEEQLVLLAKGEVDFVYGPNISAREFVLAGHSAFLSVPAFEQSVEAGSRVFAKQSDRGRRLIEEVNQGLLNLKASGDYERVLAPYFIFDSWGEQNGPKAQD